MVPCEPRKLRAVRAESGRRVKVVAGSDNVSGCWSHVERYADEPRRGLAARDGMVFAHAHEPPSPQIDAAVGITPVAGRSYRLWRTTLRQPVETLIGKLGVVHGRLRHRVGGTAVFVHARANVRAHGSDVRNAPVSALLADDAPTAFAWPALAPIDGVGSGDNAAEPERRAGHDLRR